MKSLAKSARPGFAGDRVLATLHYEEQARVSLRKSSLRKVASTASADAKIHFRSARAFSLEACGDLSFKGPENLGAWWGGLGVLERPANGAVCLGRAFVKIDCGTFS